MGYCGIDATGSTTRSVVATLRFYASNKPNVSFWDTPFGKGTFAFMEGFYDGPKSTIVSASGASGGFGLVLTGAEIASDFQASYGLTKMLRMESRQAAQFLGKVAGPALGVIGVLASTAESYYDENGYSWGDRAKTALGFGLVVLAFTAAAPAATVYAIADIGVFAITGTGITDRIGNGIDNVIKNH